MTLIIAEKPSLAQNIAAAIGGMKKQSGFYTGDKYIVTWAFGHLFSLVDVENYTGEKPGSKWSMDKLPCFPEKFRFELKKSNGKTDPGVERQFGNLRSLCNRSDVDTIVNAGDADREGEIIVRLCIENALKSKKRLLRLWLPDQTPETVRAALSDMKEEVEYDRLADEGFARTYIDWLYGVNLTRYASIRNGRLLRVGRVIVPIVRAIYDRDMEIRRFVPEKYYQLVSREKTGGEVIELCGKERFPGSDYSAALCVADEYNRAEARVVSVKKKTDTISPGKLYSLSKLQNVLGKKFKMSMTESLSIIQKLYERGYLTYPRTNSEYLATAEKDKIKKIVGCAGALGYSLKFKDRKSIFDDSKIESHSALTPTYKIPATKDLSEKEMQVYSTVFRRFAAVFCAEDCIAEKSEIKIAVGQLEEFTLKGTVIREKGWMKYDDSTIKDKLLPPLSENDIVNIHFEPVEKETTPPKHYTIETLNNYLKNPFRDEKNRADQEEMQDADDAEEYRAVFEGLELGTEATRTGIIDNARKSEYISLKKDVYTILPGGEYLIEALSRMNINMDKYKTSEMGRALKKVFRGAMTVGESVGLAEREIREIFDRQSGDAPTDATVGDVIGKCPLCGKDIVRTVYSYECTGKREGTCSLRINLSVCHRPISPAEVRDLVEHGRTPVLDGFISKSGKKFRARLLLKDGKTEFEFPPRGQTPPRGGSAAPSSDT